MKKIISVATPCYNEEDNVRQMYETIKEIFSHYPQYDYEHIFMDNCSRDRTAEILCDIAATDKRVKVILNLKNFGPANSSYHGYMQMSGDALLPIVCDFQDPPELIPRFLERWEEGYPIVAAVRTRSDEFFLMSFIRSFYYKLIMLVSDTKQLANFTGYGIYDRKVVECLKLYRESYPVLRNMVTETGFPIDTIEFEQPKRLRGKSSIGFYTLFDIAMSGFVNSSRLPLRLATFTGFGVAFCSLLVALFYFVYKLVNWSTFSTGMAPLVLGLFFFSAVQLIFLGFLGEYVGAILTQVKNRPLVIEKERINFPETENEAASKMNNESTAAT